MPNISDLVLSIFPFHTFALDIRVFEAGSIDQRGCSTLDRKREYRLLTVEYIRGALFLNKQSYHKHTSSSCNNLVVGVALEVLWLAAYWTVLQELQLQSFTLGHKCRREIEAQIDRDRKKQTGTDREKFQ